MPTVVADLNAKTPENARRQFVELYGAPLLLNRYLKIFLVLTVLLAASLVVLNFRTQARYANLKPLVIRINEVGRAEAVEYDATTYRPQAPELRYFLTRFVVTHFSRLRATVQRDYPDSLFFLAPALADATIATNDLGEPTYASPALSNGQIFLRTGKAIYCIGQMRQAKK